MELLDVPLHENLLRELRALRKVKEGVTVETIARAPIICQVLGSGDPYLAFTRLQHHLLSQGLDRTIRAAAASLGFSSKAETVLDRLNDGGAELHVDQRQVRRLSDEGLSTLARLIASNWMIEEVPELMAIVNVANGAVELHVATTRPLAVEMREPEIDVLSGEDNLPSTYRWNEAVSDVRERRSLVSPLRMVMTEGELAVVVSWKGEIWPKFTVSLSAEKNVIVETLGNKLMLRVTPICVPQDSAHRVSSNK